MPIVNSHILFPIYKDKIVFRISYLPEEAYIYNKDRKDIKQYEKTRWNDSERYTQILVYTGHLKIAGMLFVSIHFAEPELVACKNTWLNKRSYTHFSQLESIPVNKKDPYTMSLPFDENTRIPKLERELFDGCLNLFKLVNIISNDDPRDHIRYLLNISSHNLNWNEARVL